MEKLYIPIILATAHEGRQTEKAAKFVLQEVSKNKEVETELVDVRDYRIEATDNSETSETAKRFEKIVTRADGFIIVSPEYNHGYPGELKMMLDMLYKQFFRKAVAICGVSSGGQGGARMMEQLRLVMIAFHTAPIGNAVYFGNVRTLFGEDGKITDPSYEKRVAGMLDELTWFTRALKNARDVI